MDFLSVDVTKHKDRDARKGIFLALRCGGRYL
jgi:hypothetical protein